MKKEIMKQNKLPVKNKKYLSNISDNQNNNKGNEKSSKKNDDIIYDFKNKLEDYKSFFWEPLLTMMLWPLGLFLIIYKIYTNGNVKEKLDQEIYSISDNNIKQTMHEMLTKRKEKCFKGTIKGIIMAFVVFLVLCLFVVLPIILVFVVFVAKDSNIDPNTFLILHNNFFSNFF